MKIYVAHSKKTDYINELYNPLKELKEHKFILPHEKSTESINSKNIIKKCDALIAEVTIPSTSIGIEIGWADSYGIKIILLIKKGNLISNSLKNVTKNIIEYSSTQELINKLRILISKKKI